MANISKAERERRAAEEEAQSSTVHMVRERETNPAPYEADVHPDEVSAWESRGWQVAE